MRCGNVKVLHIIIDPRCMINYTSYYLYGLIELLGNDKVRFAHLDYIIANNEDYRKGFGMLVKYEDGKEVKVFVDTNDPNSIYESFYDWCDVYAKINTSEVDLSRPKIFAIGPSFGVKLWNPFTTILKCVVNYIKVLRAKDKYRVPITTYLKDYIYTFWRRLDYEKYAGGGFADDKNYIFAMSTLWYDNVSLQTVNKYRGEFIRISQRLYPTFEGGLFYIPNAEQEFPPYVQYKEEFKEVLATERIGMQTYISGTRRSAVVFNTPSVCQCHGWKLAEYLAMGKAIISTPLSNVMPGEFVDGVHYRCCNDANAIEDVMKELQADESKRESLKQNAKAYYEEYLSPCAVVRRILDRAYLCKN